MEKRILLLFLIGFQASWSIAQENIISSLQRTVPGQGKVTVYQDARITRLIGTAFVPSQSDEKNVIKKAGYRIQAYAGNNTRQAKQAAYAVAASVKQQFPELSVYTTFNPPRWLCRVGDFLTIEEADAMMRKMRATGQFKEVSIVREQIIIPL